MTKTKGNQGFEKRFEQALKAYADTYDVESLDSPNDKNNLHTMIRNQIVVEELQLKMHELTADDPVSRAMEIQKLGNLLESLIEKNAMLERQLGIDRKTRKTQQGEDIVKYTYAIKSLAHEFLERRLIKVMCKSCKILVGRVSSAYDTNEFNASFQCPQCKKHSTVTRKERDVFFDVKNADWRRRYPIEVIQPKRLSDAPDILPDDSDIVIGGVDIDDGIIMDG